LLSEQLDQPLRSALAAAEQLADGRASAREVKLTREWINALCSRYWGKVPAWVPADYLSRSVEVFPWCRSQAFTKEEKALHCDLIRDVMGNPFRLALVLQSWLSWNDGLIPKLAQAIYEERAFDRLPILGDALEEAGCTDETMLDIAAGLALMFAAAGCSICFSPGSSP